MAKERNKKQQAAYDEAMTVISDDINTYINENVQPLYDALTNYQNLLAKASILEDLDFDSSSLIQKTISRIEQEKESLTNIKYLVDARVNKAFNKDETLRSLYKTYREEIEEHIRNCNFTVKKGE